MENFELLFDIKSYSFYHEGTGYVLHAEYVMLNDNRTVVEEILAGTGVEVDEFFVEVLRDTIEANEPDFGGVWK
jgi:hypothetical protein